jgi:hypothetical protein
MDPTLPLPFWPGCKDVIVPFFKETIKDHQAKEILDRLAQEQQAADEKEEKANDKIAADFHKENHARAAQQNEDLQIKLTGIKQKNDAYSGGVCYGRQPVSSKKPTILNDPPGSDRRGSDQGSDQGSDKGSDHGSDQGSDQGSDKGSDHGSDQGSDKGSDHGSDQGSDHGSDREYDRDNWVWRSTRRRFNTQFMSPGHGEKRADICSGSSTIKESEMMTTKQCGPLLAGQGHMRPD